MSRDGGDLPAPPAPPAPPAAVAGAPGASSKTLSVKPPPPLELGENNKLAWEDWDYAFEWYAEAVELYSQPPKVQVSVFMSAIGRQVRDIFRNFELSTEEKGNLKIIREKFAEHFAPSDHEAFESYKFNSLIQGEEESIDDFITRVKTQANKCNFNSLEKSRLIRDRIIHGIHSSQMREEILKKPKVTLEETVITCRACEKAAKHTKAMEIVSSVKSEVNTVKKEKERKKEESEFLCQSCGRSHAVRKCPAYRRKCLKCNEWGHFASMCKGNGSSFQKSKKKVKKVDVNESSDSESEISVEALRVNTLNKDDGDAWNCIMRVDRKKIVVNIDTGAQCNVITKKVLAKLPEKSIEQSRVKRLIAYNGGKIKVLGRVRLECVFRKKMIPLWFQVVEGDRSCVIDGKAAVKAGLIERVNNISVSEEVFTGLGCLKDFVYDAELVDDPKFSIHPARTIPYKIEKSVKDEIDDMLKMGVIKPCKEATDAVSPMVIVRRKGKIRICVDLTDVNRNIKRRHFPLTGIDNVTARVTGSKYFSILDCKKGFWQVQLSEKTSKLCTFATPWGRFSYCRLPFGLVSAPELFQMIMSNLFEKIEGVEVSMDDILIHAATEEELHRLTEKVINILKENGLKLNRDKCLFNKTSVMFLGHRLSADGMRPDESKLAAIDLIQRPTDRKSLQRFLGTVNFVGKFISNLSHLTAPLRELLKKNVEWSWFADHEKAFCALKAALKSPPVLAYYDVNKPVTLSVDSSSHAFGSVLLQEGKPIAYATKALTDSQKNWPQIEKEAGAIRFGCRKFHNYIWGKPVIVETDHKPLESIYAKPLTLAPPRLKKILYELKAYDLSVKYVKGTDIPVADNLSRDCEEVPSDEDEEEDIEINQLTCLSDEAAERYRVAISQDSVLLKLIRYIQKGWPDTGNEVPKCIRNFFTFRDELSFTEGLIFKGERIVVPNAEKKNVLRDIHAGHVGMQASLRRARENVYWPNMSVDITEMIERCKTCEKNQRSNAKETISLKKIPEFPFEIVATDLFEYKKKQYILLVDSYSGYYDFKELKSTSSASVIRFLKHKFSEYGVPIEVHSDGGPQYRQEFKAFAKEWGFRHVTSSPYFARSNGLAERYVQTAKNLLKKCLQDGQDVRMALLLARNTPGAELRAPAERLLSRKTRNPLTSTVQSLKPRVIPHNSESLARVRNRQKEYSDRNAREFQEIPVGSQVRVQEGNKLWTSGTVISQPTGRSYHIELDDGRTIWRNRHFLHESKAGDLSSGRQTYPSGTLTTAEEGVSAEARVEQQDSSEIHPNSSGIHQDSQGSPESVNVPAAPAALPSNLPTLPTPVVTRSGRVVKPPQRLNL